MAEEKRFAKATWQIMEQLLEVESLDDALSGSLEIIVNTLNSEAGAIWLLDPKTDRLSPLFHIGPADVSNITVENGLGIEGIVTKTGKSVMVTDAASDARFDGTVFDDNGLVTKTMICVPLNNLHDVIGCVQIVNKKDGSLYDEEELQLCERMAALAAITIDEKGLIVDLGEQKEILATLKNVTKEFPSGDGVLKVLKGINLDIYKNEFVVVLGESGCGKSTMMNIVGGMDFLTDGTLTIEGKDFSHPTDAELTKYRREYIGFIFQAYNLMPNLTGEGPHGRRGGHRQGGIIGPGQQLPRPDVRRPAAAGVHRPGHREEAQADPGGRAHGGPGLHHQHRGVERHRGHREEPGGHGHDGHP